MKMSVKTLVFAALIAALYTVLTVALAPISYGMVQIRIAEALTLLPIYSPAAIWGVGVGCFLSNLIGLFTGADILGALDIPFGTLATVLAALLSRALRDVRVKGLPVLSALPPVILNAAIIGGELYFLLSPGAGIGAFLVQAGWVGLGELIACVCLGLPMCWILERTGLHRRLFGASDKLEPSGVGEPASPAGKVPSK